MEKNEEMMTQVFLPAGADKEHFNSENNWHVKVFRQTPMSSWDDCGTGYAQLLNKVFFF